LQLIVPGRHAYFSDFVINSSGAYAGLVLALLFDGGVRAVTAIGFARPSKALEPVCQPRQ
jgi:hypothetical protein